MVNQFVSHYGDRFKVQKVTQELLSSKPNNNESLSQFCTRFQLLVEDAQVEDDSSLVVRHLISVFPEQIQWMIYQALDTQRITGMSISNVCDYIQSMPINSHKDNLLTISKTNWRSVNSSESNYNYCSYHKRIGHSDKDSRVLNRFKEEADKSKFTTPASRINKPATTHNTTTTVTSTGNSKGVQSVSNNRFTGFSTKTVMCNKCHQIGHYANQCNNPNIKFTEVPPEDSGLTDIPTTTYTTIQPSEPPIKPYTIPVYVNGHKVMAFIDTCADRTFMSQKLSKPLSLNITEIQGIIHTANSEVHIPRIETTEEVRIKSQDIDCIHKCELLLGSNESLIIGRDLIPKLKLNIFGLPFNYPNQDISILEDSDNATDNELKDPAAGEYNYALDKNRRKMLLYIQPLIDINPQIPLNAACLLEEAVVYLPTPEGQSVFKRQYKIAETLQPALDEVIQK
ncbi:hypothetical protein BB560_005333, partial [Smittium megazygosporum]